MAAQVFLGLDVGFGYTKVTDGQQFQIIKSVLGEYNPSSYSESLAGDLSAHPRAVRVDDLDWFVGEVAEEFSQSREYTTDLSKFLTDNAKPLAITAVLPYCRAAQSASVVSGLPVKVYRRFLQPYAHLLEGNHQVEILAGADERKKVEVCIERVRVIPQPMGSFYHQLLDTEGRIVNDDLLHSKVGIIDIGFRTCDFAMVSNTRYVDRGSHSIDAGMFVAHSAIVSFIHEQTGVDVELYRLYNPIRKRQIKVNADRFDIGPLVDKAYSELAARIANEAGQLWANEWDIEWIGLTGGGAADLFPYLKDLLRNDVKLMAQEKDLRMVNAWGYQRFARHLWDGKNSQSILEAA